MKALAIIVTTLFTLTACSRSDGMHEYELNGVVADVIDCDDETQVCSAWVYKGENEKYNEIWRIDGTVKKGDKVSKTCRFTIIDIEEKDESMSAGLSSRKHVEKTLNNSNCDAFAHPA